MQARPVANDAPSGCTRDGHNSPRRNRVGMPTKPQRLPDVPSVPTVGGRMSPEPGAAASGGDSDRAVCPLSRVRHASDGLSRRVAPAAHAHSGARWT